MIASETVLTSVPAAEEFRFWPPSFSIAAVADLLQQLYGVQGNMVPLAGERDQNICVTTREGLKFVLKISAPMETAETVDFQNLVLEHIRCAKSCVGVPEVVPARGGALRSTVSNGLGVEHHVRLLTYVPGVPLDIFGSCSVTTMHTVGSLIGTLDRALESVVPLAKPDFMPWDVMNGLIIADGFRETYMPDDLKDTCLPFLERFASETLPSLYELPGQVIHNDLHPGNVLCESSDPSRLTGCIDFGDIVHRPIVMELASSLAEFVGLLPDVATGARAMLDGFRDENHFREEHLPLLYDATLARAILCAQLAMFRVAHANTDEAIETAHLPGAIGAVNALVKINRDAFVTALREPS